MGRTVSLTLVTACLWFLLSGYTTAFILSLGAASVGLVVYLAHRMDVVDHEGHPMHLSWRGFGYWPWLLWEIAKSNLAVARVILGNGKAIRPHVLDLPASQDTDLGQVIYANSITLTPGTMTIMAEPGHVRVHALTEAAAHDLLAGEMDRRVCRMANADRPAERSP